MAGIIITNLRDFGFNRYNKIILKTNDDLRYKLILQNYCDKVVLDPNYVVCKDDLVFHIIDPRNICSGHNNVFIDNIGDYWCYLGRTKQYEHRLNLYYNGINNSSHSFITSFENLNTTNRYPLHHFAFIDKHIVNKMFKSNCSNSTMLSDDVLYLGSFKSKNELFDQNVKNTDIFNYTRTTDRRKIVDLIFNSSLIVTHPGINSISESLYLNKPYIYVAPANLEQTINCDIIERHGLGIVIKEYSEINLELGFKQMRLQYNEYKQNIDKFVKLNQISFSNFEEFLRGIIHVDV